jgi:hypothetical protein
VDRFSTILIGVFGALSGVYLRESFRRAVHQKLVATKLLAQLDAILRDLNDANLSQLVGLGWAWRRIVRSWHGKREYLGTRKQRTAGAPSLTRSKRQLGKEVRN